MAAPKNNMDKKAPAKNVAGVRSDREKLFRALLVLFILNPAATGRIRRRCSLPAWGSAPA